MGCGTAEGPPTLIVTGYLISGLNIIFEEYQRFKREDKIVPSRRGREKQELNKLSRSFLFQSKLKGKCTFL